MLKIGLKQSALLALFLLAVFAPSAISQTKRKPVRKTSLAKTKKLSEQAQAAQDLADILSGKSKKPLLTAKDMLPAEGAVVISPDGTYTNYFAGYSAKFPDRDKIKKGTNSFFDDFSVFVNTGNGFSQMWFVGKPSEFTCNSADSCAEKSIENHRRIESFELLSKENLNLQGMTAVRVKFKYTASDNEVKKVDEVHIFREVDNSNISYAFSLLSSDKEYESDAVVFENVLSSLKFIKPKILSAR